MTFWPEDIVSLSPARTTLYDGKLFMFLTSLILQRKAIFLRLGGSLSSANWRKNSSGKGSYKRQKSINTTLCAKKQHLWLI